MRLVWPVTLNRVDVGAGMIPDVLVGTQLGGYRIDALIGAGGMGRVYRAEHLTLRRRVAMKVLAPELSSDRTYRDRFLHESRLAASIEHTNILPIYDAGESGGYLYLAMRLVEGTDLRQVLEREGAVSPSRALSLLTQAALALDAAHAHGLIHRDVKPANLLLEGEHLFLTDFGVAKSVGDVRGLTRVGIFVGTIDYASPEQIRQEPLDGRTDLYALACVFYQALTGKAPFDRPTDHAIVQAHLSEAPPSILMHGSDLPPALDLVFATALAKDREARYRSGRYFADAARWALEGRSDAVRARSTVIDESPLPPVQSDELPLAIASTEAAIPPAKPGPLSGRQTLLAVGVAALILGAIGVQRMLPVDRNPAAPTAQSLASPTPTLSTPSPTPTLKPTPTHPYSVSLRPEQLIMSPSEFPLSGFSVSRDRSWYTAILADGWDRQFSSTGGQYWYAEFIVTVYGESARASDKVAATQCSAIWDWSESKEQPIVTEITAEVIGDAAKACRFAFPTIGDWVAYTTGTRNVTVTVGVEVRSVGISQAIAMSVQLARQQLTIIERAAPR